MSSTPPPVIIRRKAAVVSVAAAPQKVKAKAQKPVAAKNPPKKTLGLKQMKLSPDRVGQAKAALLKHPEARRLRPCYVDELARRSVYHGKDRDEAWLKTELKSYQQRQLKHFLRVRILAHAPPLAEKRQQILSARLAVNFEKQLRKAGFHPDFLQFYFLEEFQTLQEMFGKDCWYFMKRHLQDLGGISPLWAAQFLTAVSKIDPERLKGEADKYSFVTGSPEFKEAGPARPIFLEKLAERFLTLA
jgi:hypothetical protein